MLRLLRIRDFALINTLEVEFGPGLNLLTGETGSGKSIVVDALGFLAGRRASPDVVRSGCESSVIEGTFTFDPHGPVPGILENGGVGVEDDFLVIRREINVNGRGRIFLNNALATLTLLRAVGEQLADIHGQQDQLSLQEPCAQLDWLDRFGRNNEILTPVRACHSTLVGLATQLESLRMDEQERLRRIDILQFQIGEINRARLQPNEKEELENERNILTNSEKVFSLSSEAYGLLYEEESSLLAQARRLERLLEELNSFDSRWTPHREALAEAVLKLQDTAFAMRDYRTKIDFSPERLNEVEHRLSELDRLSRKYGNCINDIITYGNECEKQLEELISHADRSARLSAELEGALGDYAGCAGRLSAKRRADAERLERETRREFAALAMERMRLEVRFKPPERVPDGRIPAHYGPGGFDNVEFMIAPNVGEEMKPLTKIASGGELSRVMLAIKSLCGGGEAGKTLVFDEVDAGIGGRVAEAVGKRLRDLGRSNQVLCVTHLPQIAAFAEHHFSVCKKVVGTRTETGVEALTEKGRVEELARMLGGEVITEITRRHAREMLTSSATPADASRGLPPAR